MKPSSWATYPAAAPTRRGTQEQSDRKSVITEAQTMIGLYGIPIIDGGEPCCYSSTFLIGFVTR